MKYILHVFIINEIQEEAKIIHGDGNQNSYWGVTD